MSTPLDSETKSIIENTLLRFIEESYDPHDRHERLMKAGMDYMLFWPVLADLGVLGMPFTEEQGGLGGYALDTVDAVITLAKGLILEPFVEVAVIAGSVLAFREGSQAEIAELISGEAISILLGGRKGDRDAMTLRRDESGYLLSGSLRVQPFAEQADFWLIAAHDVGSGTSVVLRLERHSLAAQVQSYRLLDARPASDIVFVDEPLPPESLWLEGAEADAALERAGLLAASCLCADAVGVMASLLAITGDYLRTRVQFGTPLSSFQALQHRYASMQMLYLEARAISRKLAISLDKEPGAVQAWLSFAAASVVERAANLVGHESIQMHGGMGVTDELVVSHYNNRLVVLVRMLHAWVDRDVELLD